nr:unnamed protein product [Callosobruchus analis]
MSYKVSWSIFHSKFNIKFGLPRTDTCSICDSLRLKEAAAENENLKSSTAAERELHLRKAQAFYDLKKPWTVKAKSDGYLFRFHAKPSPHIRDNLAFRWHQLWYYAFGVHDLADDKASMAENHNL